MAPSDGDRSRARPIVVAHRGASDELAEHTLAAYRQALADGADALECDVRLTRDGHLVCLHDRRLERTSTGRGVVSAKRLEELHAFDWVSWKHPRSHQDQQDELDRSAGSLLTLRELLAMVRDHHAPVELAIETKHPTRYSGLVEHYLVEMLHRFGWSRPAGPCPVRVMSFSRMSVRRMQRLAPAVPVVVLVDDRIPITFRGGELPYGVDIVGPSIELVRADPDWVRKVHASRHRVHVWTVNEPADVALCAELGIEAIITDRPGETRAQLDAL